MSSLRGRLSLGVLGVVAALALVAVPAQASLHPFVGTLASQTLLNDACGLTVGPEGLIYVSDYQNDRVVTFNDGGGFVGAIPTARTENSTCALAVDSGGHIYADYFRGPVEVFGTGTGVIDAERSTGVAVDPGTDDLYVTHGDQISAYEAPVLPGDTPTTIGAGALGDAYAAAVSGFAATSGYLYVGDAADDTVKVFDPATDTDDPIATIDGAETPLGEFRDLTDTALAVDDSNGHLFVLDNLQPGFVEPLAAVYEFDEAGNYLGQLLRKIVHGGPSGLAVNNSIDSETGKTRGTIYVTSGNEVRVLPGNPPGEEGSQIYSFCAAGACSVSPSHPLELVKSGSGAGVVTSFLPGAIGATLPGLECGTICATEFDQGTLVTLIATPRPHSAFTGWSVAGQPAACPGTGNCKVTVNAATEVTANFTAIPQQTLSVAKTGSGQGTITSSPAGIECGTVCAAPYDRGSTVALVAEAVPGSEFTGWSGACSGVGICKVNLAGDQSVGAEFRAISRLVPVERDSGKRTLAISVTGDGAGTITSDPAGIECGTPCSGAYAPGTRVTLTAKADSESRFLGFSGCDSSTASTCTLTLSSSRTVGASFAEYQPLELAGLSLNGAKAALSVVVPAKGTLSAKARQLAPSSVKAKKASTLTLPLSLNKAARKALARKGKLEVKVKLTFKPSNGDPAVTLEKTITFRKKGGR